MYITRILKGWKWKILFFTIILVLFSYYSWFFSTKFKDNLKIAILIIVTNDTDIGEYEIALESVKCYAKAQKYEYILLRDTGPEAPCLQKDFLFRRHCKTAHLLQNYDVIMFLDADIGVVNPKKRIEDYLEDDVDITFYDRYQNWEVATGSYLVRNTQYARDFLNGFADYEDRLPMGSFHGSDNGAIHMFLAEKLLPTSILRSSKCPKLYKNSKNFEDLFTFEACIRNLLDDVTSSGKVRILKKGNGWVRDSWLTNSLWNPEVDFMLHGWKMSQLREVPNWELRPIPLSRNQWFNPFLGEKCSWSYNPNKGGVFRKVLGIF